MCLPYLLGMCSFWMTALDEENMEGFIRILELVKSHFKNVILISHLDSLKDSVDLQISIEKKDKFAFVNQ